MRERINDNTVICIWFRMHYAIDTGVGIVSVYFLSGFVRTSFRINESAPHFLCIITNLSLLPGKNQMAIRLAMKKIVVVLAVSLTIVVIVLCGEKHYLSVKKYEYKHQLEDLIDNKYLEGENAIGAFLYETRNNDSTEINKVSDFGFDYISWLPIKKASIWGGRYFNHVDVIEEMMRNGVYKWYDFSHCATSHPFMIIVKKTDRGYDIIGEFLLGVGLTNLYPDCRIFRKSTKFNWGILSNNKEVITYDYKIKTDMINSYFENLFENKYKGITIRDEVVGEDKLFSRNMKLEMLDNLVMKSYCPADSSLYFRINKYFELKPDEDFTSMGSSPILWKTGTYGNQAQKVFTKTIIMHYSIQENCGVLEAECRKLAIVLLMILESIWFFISFMMWGKVVFVKNEDVNL